MKLPENLEKLILSSNIEDVVIGFTLIKERLGLKWFTDQMSPIMGHETDSKSGELYRNRFKAGGPWVLIKVVEGEFIIHLLTEYFVFHTYKKEYPNVHSPKYDQFTVYEI